MNVIVQNTTKENNKKTRFGILCNSFSFKAWQINTIEQLLESNEIELCLIIINAETTNKEIFFKKIENWIGKNFIHKFYTKYFFKPSSTKETDLFQKLFLSHDSSITISSVFIKLLQLKQ